MTDIQNTAKFQSESHKYTNILEIITQNTQQIQPEL
jgi:hypothetical protein